MAIVKFTQHSGYYYTDWDGDMSGEYVPLVEYLELKQGFVNTPKETNAGWNETCNATRKTGEVIEHTLEGKITELKALIQRVIEMRSDLHDDEEFTSNPFLSPFKNIQSPELIQLLEDCQEAIA